MTITNDLSYDHQMDRSNQQAIKETLFLYGIFTVLPVFVGVMLYVLFRQNLPLILKSFWPFESIKISSKYDWIVYNLPDGLWAFGFMSFLIVASRKDSKYVRTFYLFLGLILMIALEATQGWLLPGTFDLMDIFAILAGACFSWLLLRFVLIR